MFARTKPDPHAALDANARRLEQIILAGAEKVGATEYHNARESYLTEIPADIRRVQVMSSSDEWRTCMQQSSAGDSRDASAVAMAAENRKRWRARFPQCFPADAPATPQTPHGYSFDEQASRQALITHLAAMASAQAEVDKLLAVDRAASAAGERVRHAQDVVDAIDARQRQRWDDWQRGDVTAPHPQPETEARAAALTELSAAKETAQQATAAAERSRPQYTAAAARVQELSERRAGLVADILATALPRLVARKLQQEAALRQTIATIDGITKAMSARGVDWSKPMEASAPNRDQYRAALAVVDKAARAKVDNWAAKLSGDPSAVLELDQ
jgi:hypothetical protein